MNTRLKKLLPAAVAGCLLYAPQLLAAYGDACNSCPPKPCPPEPVCEPCDEVLERNQVFDDCNCKITPNAGPRVACGTDLFITADYILWNARMEGLGYAATGAGGQAGFTPASKGSVSHPDFSWNSGFKVGLGYNLDHDGWDVFAEYTWLRPSDNSSKSSDDPVASNLISLWPANSGAGGTVMERVRGSWDYDLNVVDLELGRNYFISRFLTLRPHFGLKGIWNDMDFHVASTVDNPQADEEVHRVDYNQDYWAVGLRTGLDTVWYFNRYFGIYGDFALSALWGKYDVDYKTSVITTTANVVTNTTNNHLENEFYGLKSVFEIVLGFQGDFWFSDDAFHLGMNLGWEMQYWPNQNQLFRFFEESNHGDLSFMGLVAGLRFDF